MLNLLWKWNWTQLRPYCIASFIPSAVIPWVKKHLEPSLKVKTAENKELVVKLSALIIASDGMITDVEKTTFKNIRNFLGEKESKYKDIMSEGELDRDKILEHELKIMNLLPPIESIN